MSATGAESIAGPGHSGLHTAAPTQSQAQATNARVESDERNHQQQHQKHQQPNSNGRSKRNNQHHHPYQKRSNNDHSGQSSSSQNHPPRNNQGAYTSKTYTRPSAQTPRARPPYKNQNQGPPPNAPSGPSATPSRPRSYSPTSTSPHPPPQHTSSPRASEPIYILTLLTNPSHHNHMTSLRQRYFPAQLNKIPAHVTLFHALPGSSYERIERDIREVVGGRKGFRIAVGKEDVFRMRKGVGVNVGVGAKEARGIYNELRARWSWDEDDVEGDNQEQEQEKEKGKKPKTRKGGEEEGGFLSPQDRSGFKAHYTIQNKVDDEKEVERTIEELSREFKGDEGVVTGLRLYRYDKGFWRDGRDFLFSDQQETKHQ